MMLVSSLKILQLPFWKRAFLECSPLYVEDKAWFIPSAYGNCPSLFCILHIIANIPDARDMAVTEVTHNPSTGDTSKSSLVLASPSVIHLPGSQESFPSTFSWIFVKWRCQRLNPRSFTGDILLNQYFSLWHKVSSVLQSAEFLHRATG